MWELWEAEDGLSHAFGPADSPQHRQLLDESERLIWTVEAPSYNDAQRALHDHMGWDPYIPMLQDDGSPYPEDEAPADD